MARPARSKAASTAASSSLPASMPMPIIEPPHLAADLRELKLPAFGRHWRALAERARREALPVESVVAELAHLEVTERRERRINRRIHEARFPIIKTLDAFDFAAQPSIDREQILDLATGQFVEQRLNLVLCGGVGTGKSHLAVALGVACCQREYRVRFTTAAELTQTLIEAKAENRLSRTLDRLARFDLVAIDELGFVPFDAIGAELLFNFITKVYEKRSLIVTTNLPFSRWNEVFHDATAAAAVIDRIVHHSIILQTDGESFRLKAAKHQQRKERGH